MSPAPHYDRGEQLTYCGVDGTPSDYQASVAVILPVPLERTTTYVGGTRNGPREILLASTQMEVWDEEFDMDVRERGVHTLPEMLLPFGDLGAALDEIHRVTSTILAEDKFLVVLGGEHSITPPIVRAAVEHHEGLTVLQIDAHADLRDSYLGSPFNHACAMRRTLEHAPCVQVGIRSLSAGEARAIPSLPTTVFYDSRMRQDPDWIRHVIDALSDKVYITVDCDGIDPAVMPAVGTPEPGGLSWQEVLALLRATFRRRIVVGCDIVELCPIPGLLGPNFLCAKLIYKILTYRFAFA